MGPTCTATGRDLAAVAVATPEREFVETVTDMLGDPDWLLPIVAAQPQYRATYYGLTAAALLEDVWFDAFANWVARSKPTTTVQKTPRGVAGASGDYVVDGQGYSHKSGNGPQATGVHWDALVAAGQSKAVWSSTTPIAYVASGYGNITGKWHPASPAGTASTSVVRASWPPPEKPPAGRTPMLVRWEPSGAAEIIARWSSLPSFTDVWPVLAEHVAGGAPANHFELLWVSTKGGPVEGDEGRIELPGRPGFFVFPADLLRDVPTGKNNRATLLTKATIVGLMTSASHLGLWSPMPMWYAAFAPARPPDLYLAQRSEFDRRFSPVAGP